MNFVKEILFRSKLLITDVCIFLVCLGLEFYQRKALGAIQQEIDSS
jgi:hypothetical protein